MTLAAAREAAEKADRLFPLSLASEGSCQIGGNLATNAGGVGVLAYGNARALALGLEVVLADGRTWNGLRALRKDNTGYDLRDLFIGSEGTLGVITAAVLQLFPRPRETATAYAGCANLEDVARLYEFARSSGGGSLTAFELIPRIGIEFVLRHASDVHDPLHTPSTWYVLLEFSGARADGATENAMQKLLEIAHGQGLVTDATPAQSRAQAADFWRLRELMSEMQKPEGGSIKHDVSVPVALDSRVHFPRRRSCVKNSARMPSGAIWSFW